MKNAREAATKALRIDDTLPEAHVALGLVKNIYDWEWSQAESEFKRAIELRPNYAEAHQWYADFLMQMGRFNEARSRLEKAQDIDPLSLFIRNQLGLVYYYERNYDQAIQQYMKTIETDPKHISAHILIGRAYAQKGAYKEAMAEFQRARELDDSPDILADIGRCYALSGKEKEARKVLAELASRTYVSPYFFALIRIGLGEKEQALEWLEKSYEERSSTLVWLKVNPSFDTLRSDPKFINLIERVGYRQ
jgi:tetratricopeptide (TPR) repeat protein